MSGQSSTFINLGPPLPSPSTLSILSPQHPLRTLMPSFPHIPFPVGTDGPGRNEHIHLVLWICKDSGQLLNHLPPGKTKRVEALARTLPVFLIVELSLVPPTSELHPLKVRSMAPFCRWFLQLLLPVML